MIDLVPKYLDYGVYRLTSKCNYNEMAHEGLIQAEQLYLLDDDTFTEELKKRGFYTQDELIELEIKRMSHEF